MINCGSEARKKKDMRYRRGTYSEAESKSVEGAQSECGRAGIVSSSSYNAHVAPVGWPGRLKEISSLSTILASTEFHS